MATIGPATPSISRRRSFSCIRPPHKTSRGNLRPCKSLGHLNQVPHSPPVPMDRLTATIEVLKARKTEIKTKSEQRQKAVEALVALGVFATVMAVVAVCGITQGLGAGAIVIAVFGSATGILAGIQ